jgi:S-methylmethionine-dependent homocysteine/selenocysteine methylase
VLFNCCKPEAITKASKEIVSKPDIYQYLHHPPHAKWSSSQSSDAHNSKIFLGAYDLPPDSYWKFVKCWHGGDGIDGSKIGGMLLIGICCGIGPDRIHV